LWEREGLEAVTIKNHQPVIGADGDRIFREFRETPKNSVCGQT
jgi:hypothetical protein